MAKQMMSRASSWMLGRRRIQAGTIELLFANTGSTSSRRAVHSPAAKRGTGHGRSPGCEDGMTANDQGEKPLLTDLASWKALAKHHATIGNRHLREFFAADPERGTRLAASAAGLYLDYS